MSADASRSARRKLALRLGTLALARRLWDDSGRSPRRAIGPTELIRTAGSTWTEVDAENSLRASFGCQCNGGLRRSASSDMPVSLNGPAACRLSDAYARPTQSEGGNRAERFIRASSSQRVRVVTSQRERFEPCAACCIESSTRRAGSVRVRARTDFPAAASASDGRHAAGPLSPARRAMVYPAATDIKSWFEYRVGS
jgi:hypothetical protein